MINVTEHSILPASLGLIITDIFSIEQSCEGVKAPGLIITDIFSIEQSCEGVKAPGF